MNSGVSRNLKSVETHRGNHEDTITPSPAVPTDAIDPKVLRLELKEKHRLLNLLESKGVHVPHGKELTSKIEAALCDLDRILCQTEQT